MRFIYLILAIVFFVVDLIVFFQNIDSVMYVQIFSEFHDAITFMTYIMTVSFLFWIFSVLSIKKFLDHWGQSDDWLDL